MIQEMRRLYSRAGRRLHASVGDVTGVGVRVTGDAVERGPALDWRSDQRMRSPGDRRGAKGRRAAARHAFLHIEALAAARQLSRKGIVL